MHIVKGHIVKDLGKHEVQCVLKDLAGVKDAAWSGSLWPAQCWPNRPLYATLAPALLEHGQSGLWCCMRGLSPPTHCRSWRFRLGGIAPRRAIVHVLDRRRWDLCHGFRVRGQWPGSRIVAGEPTWPAGAAPLRHSDCRPPRPCSNPSAACWGTSLNIQPVNLPKVTSVRRIPQRSNEPSTGSDLAARWCWAPLHA